MNLESRTLPLQDNWTAVVSEDGRRIDFCRAGVMSMTTLAWSFPTILLAAAVAGGGRGLATYTAGDFHVALDIPARAVIFQRDGKTALAISLEEANGIHALGKTALDRFRQQRQAA